MIYPHCSFPVWSHSWPPNCCLIGSSQQRISICISLHNTLNVCCLPQPGGPVTRRSWDCWKFSYKLHKDYDIQLKKDRLAGLMKMLVLTNSSFQQPFSFERQVH